MPITKTRNYNGLRFQIGRRETDARVGDLKLGSKEVWDAYVIGDEGAILEDQFYFDDPQQAESWAKERIDEIQSRQPQD